MSVEIAPRQTMPVELIDQESLAHAARATMLRGLLGVDYSHAVDSGLVDMFYFDPKTGEDAIPHILGGSLKTSRSGAAVPVGLHHAPSIAQFWPSLAHSDGSEVEDTYAHNHEGRDEWFPLEPYPAEEVVIGGIKKMGFRTCPETKQRRILPATNTMFPRGYDSYAVLQSIRLAYTNRDQSLDYLAVLPHPRKGEMGRIRAVGSVPLADGKTQMRVKIVSDFETETIVTAMPLLDETGVMGLAYYDIPEFLISGAGIVRSVTEGDKR